MFVADHHTPEQLQEFTLALNQKRIWRRAQAEVLAKQGLGCPSKVGPPEMEVPR